MLRDGVAVDALALLGEPFDEGGGIDDLALGFRQRLALLGGHQLGEVFLVLQHEIGPLAHHLGALLGGFGAPGGKCPLGGLDRAPRLVRPHARDGAEDLVGGRIVDLDRGLTVGIDPGAVDVAFLPEQALVLELHGASPSQVWADFEAV